MSQQELFALAVQAGIYTKKGKLTKGVPPRRGPECFPSHGLTGPPYGARSQTMARAPKLDGG